MSASLHLDGQTKLTDIMAEYPWLKGELIRKDPQFKRLDSPMAKILLKKATLTDASRFSGVPVEELIRMLGDMVRQHGEQSE